MSREIKTHPGLLSVDPEEVPIGKMLVGFYLPIEAVDKLTLGTPVTITLPEATL